MNGEKGFMEIKMNSGWYMTISLQKSDRSEEEKEYVEIAKERGGQKQRRFFLNPKYTRALGEALVKFADENKL